MVDEIRGMKELIEELNGFPARVQKNVLRQSVFRGAQELAEVARRNAPVSKTSKHPGKLRDSIKPYRGGGTRGMVVARVEVGAFYAKWVEFGNSRAPAHPFLIPAFNKERERILERIQKGLATEIEKKMLAGIQGRFRDAP